MSKETRLFDSNRFSQVTGEIDINTTHNSQVIREQLHGDNVDDTLETINGRRDTNGLELGRDTFVTDVANNDGVTFTSSDLLKSRLDFLLI